MGDGDRTQIAIVGAGPAGLMLGRMLSRRGVETVVLESRSRDYVESRVRAGVLEQGTVELLVAEGVGERLEREGNVHHGIELRFGGVGHRLAFDELAQGRGITIYGQQEVVKDLVAARVDGGLPLRFEAERPASVSSMSTSPFVRYRDAEGEHELRCDFVAGCDGFHGVCREAIPAGVLTVRERIYPFGWLGILAEVPPSSAELVYAYSERGFALHSSRSPELSRLYVHATRATSSTGGPTSGSGMSSTAGSPAATAGSSPEAPSSSAGSRRCAASSLSRCSTVACSWPGMRSTSSRRPAPRGSTSRSPTSACSRRRWSRFTRTAIAPGWTPTRRPACGASGGRSTSPGG